MVLVHSTLQAASNKDITDNILSTFVEIEKKYYLQEWKTSELEAGHFVEAVLRFIELKLTGSFTPIGKQLPKLNIALLNKFENLTGNESYRLLIPRVLLAIYNIRNKRGIGHLSTLAANKQDATFILSSCKWILSEMFRIEATVDITKASETVEMIGERTVEAIWDIHGRKRILHSGLGIREQILILLFDKSPSTFTELKTSIESKNDSYLRRIIKDLHTNRILENIEDGNCYLSPKGRIVAEKLVLTLGVK